ncbi:unnamed protein product, partial [marine sediment metagenome]
RDGKNSPPLDLNSPLPTGPQGKTVTCNLGPVALETYSPVTITPIEYSTNFYIYARNNGDTVATVCGPMATEVAIGPWVQHFFELNPYPQEIQPDETAVFEFMLAEGGDGKSEVVLPFTLLETGEQTSLEMKIISEGQSRPEAFQRSTAAIEGCVSTPEGTPLPGVTVTVDTFNARESWRSQTDSDGKYYVTIPSSEDMIAALGDRPLPYHSLGFTIIAEPEGYTIGYQDEIEVARGETRQVDFTVEPITSREYIQTGEYTSDGAHGYWWVLPTPGFKQIASVQARHPPALDEPGHIVMIDTEGNELWQYPTAAECWGFDVSVNGDVAAGSHNGQVYLLDSDGNLRWQVDSQQMNRWVRFSPDGSSLITGPFGGKDVALMEVASGKILWESSERWEWLRNAAWSPDGRRVITGHSGGKVAMFTRDGELLWRQAIGEFPMVLEIDSDYNTYMAGKNRELFSYDADGNLRWRRRVGNHVVTAGWNN